MGWHEISLEQRKGCRAPGPRRTFDGSLHSHPDLEARQSHRAATNHQAEEHGFWDMVLILHRRSLLSLNLLRKSSLNPVKPNSPQLT